MGTSQSRRNSISAQEIQRMVAQLHLSPAEIQDLHQQFRERFTSGVISLSEFEKYCLKYASTKTFTPTRPFIELVFKAINRTKSGEISFSEFLDFLHMVKKGKPEEKLKWVFQLYLGDKAKTETTNEITKEDIVETLTVTVDGPGDMKIFRGMRRSDRAIYASKYPDTADKVAERNGAMLMSMLDADGNKHLTEEEFTEAAKNIASEILSISLGKSAYNAD